jgi:GxxExxY protein
MEEHNSENYLHSELSSKVIKAYFNVYNELGYGFLERVYERALVIELGKMGLTCVAQHPLTVYYDGHTVGEYYADLVIENTIIVELKAVEELSKAHEAQLVNYLRATRIEVGLLFNFGKKPEHKRKIFENRLK